METAFLRTLLALALALVLTAGALVLWFRTRRVTAMVQLLGAAGILVVALAHLAEVAHLLPFMGWGRPDSAGHYLDLVSAVAGATLFPVGYLAQALRTRGA